VESRSDPRLQIEEQRRTINELQTPVLQVWDGVLALPIIGSLDTARAQDMTEALLARIVETGSELVILDQIGHLAAYEAPGTVNALIDDFLDRHRR